jgi:glycine cleavage system H lipoate-binding protein/TusA-related sulfurtransferase
LEVDNCEFPDDVLYDEEFYVWVKVQNQHAVLGITSIQSALAGKLNEIKFKEVGTKISKGRSVATLESAKFFGSVRTPIAGRLVETNGNLLKEPKLANDDPYRQGWFVKLEPEALEQDLAGLQTAKGGLAKTESQIRELGIRCFKATPDYEMWEIGTECAAVLSRLNELMEQYKIGDVVHVVSDDKFADVEIARWSDQTGQQVLESRQEAKLMHFIIKKVK